MNGWIWPAIFTAYLIFIMRENQPEYFWLVFAAVWIIFWTIHHTPL